MNSKFDKLYNLIMENAQIKFGRMEDDVAVKDMVCKIFASRKDGQPLTDEEYEKEVVNDKFVEKNGGFKKPSEINWDWHITYPVGDDPVPRIILTSSHVDNPNAGNMFLVRNTPENTPTIDHMPQFVSMDEAKEFMKKYMEQNYDTFVNIVENRWKKERDDKTSEK